MPGAAVVGGLEEWVVEALKAQGGSATVLNVCKFVWKVHEEDLKRSGDTFFTWQYDIRWAADRLRRKRIMRETDISPKGVWELTEG